MKEIRFAVVGCGHIGKRHATLIHKGEGSKLVAVADINPDLASTVKEEFDVPFYSSLEELLENESDFDVINVCTPNGLHAEQSLAALEKGFHVVCEKPMALNSADCREMISLAKQVDKKIFCVMQNRYSPPSAWLKGLIDEGRFGEIYKIQIGCYWNRDTRYYKKGHWHGTKDLDGGTLFTQFSHFVDLMYWLFGDVSDVHSRISNFNHQSMIEFEDTGVFSFRLQSGGIGSFNYSTSVWDKNMESSIIIVGEKGSVKVCGQYMDKVEYCHIENYDMPELPPSNPPNDYGAYKGSAANHIYIIQNVVQTLNGKAEVDIKPEEGLIVVDLIERVYESAKVKQD